jgi:hypothetical protein
LTIPQEEETEGNEEAPLKESGVVDNGGGNSLDTAVDDVTEYLL